MLDSTARAERIDLASSEAQYFTWEVAQKPVAVRLPMALIDRLESEAVENFRSLTSRGSEIGGILLGSLAPGSPAIVTVADFELISCDYNRGPLYRLSDADLGRFEQALEKRAAGGSPRVIGFFRSHTRKGLSLDAEDLAFFEPRFLEPQNIVLLVRPFATKASTAGIFIRENGRISAETSYLEFPFRSSELAAGRAAEKAEPAAAAPAQQAPAAKPVTRAQIVPIASRREITLPDPVPSTPAPTVASERIEAAAPAPSKPQPPAPAFEKPVEKEKEKAAAPVAPPPAEPEVKKEPEAKKEAKPEVKPDPKPQPKLDLKPAAPIVFGEDLTQSQLTNPKNKKLRLIVAAAAMLVVAGGSLVIYPMLKKSVAPRVSTTGKDSSALALRVERTTGGMQLTWNRDLPAIQSASKVVLAITDGDRHENIELDPNQVRTGGFVYSPITGDVSFQMEVTDAHQTKTSSESLRVVDPRPSPLADPASADAAKQAAAKSSTTTTTPAATTPAATSTTTPPATEAAASETPEETPAQKPAAPLKPFNSQSLAQRLRPVPQSAVALPDAPAISRANNPALGNLSGIVPGTAPVAPPPPRPSGTPSPVTGGQIIPAQVISRVDPVYPRFAQQSGAGGMVELEATITPEGVVKNPHVTHGNVMLQKAAIDAVLQWRYRPAMLNGKPVESPVDIKLNFVTSR